MECARVGKVTGCVRDGVNHSARPSPRSCPQLVPPQDVSSLPDLVFHTLTPSFPRPFSPPPTPLSDH
eukprot:1537148-Rhodomonas_salina.2